MKRKLFKSIVAAGAVAMVCACGDDPSSPDNQQPGFSSAVIDPTSSAVVGPNSSGSVNFGSSGMENPGSSANPDNPLSSGAVIPGSSAGVAPEGSSSSANTEPELDANGFPTLESYGPPPAEYTKDISATAKRGWNTRYWDACKPHCSWLKESSSDKTRADTSSDEAYLAEFATARNCNIHDVEVPTFTVGNVTKKKRACSRVPTWLLLP